VKSFETSGCELHLFLSKILKLLKIIAKEIAPKAQKAEGSYTRHMPVSIKIAELSSKLFCYRALGQTICGSFVNSKEFQIQDLTKMSEECPFNRSIVEQNMPFLKSDVSNAE
jgi:hypothetical protein